MLKANNLFLGLTAASLCAYPAGAQVTQGVSLSLSVPVHCQIRHNATGYGADMGGGVVLGQLSEYCNAASGYTLTVNYTPGTLHGTVLEAGMDRVVLDGSGQATFARANGPLIRARPLVATPGASGFDADRLDFEIVPSAI